MKPIEARTRLAQAADLAQGVVNRLVEGGLIPENTGKDETVRKLNKLIPKLRSVADAFIDTERDKIRKVEKS